MVEFQNFETRMDKNCFWVFLFGPIFKVGFQFNNPRKPNLICRYHQGLFSLK